MKALGIGSSVASATAAASVDAVPPAPSQVLRRHLGHRCQALQRLGWIALGLALGPSPLAFDSPVPALVPKPVSVQLRDGSFRLTQACQIVAEGGASGEAVMLADLLAPALGGRLPVLSRESAPGDTIALILDASRQGDLGTEGYTLHVAPRRIEIRASASAGLFYAIQTLRQLLPEAVYRRAPLPGTAWAVPGVEILDRPRFAWRGLLIDPARHFIPKLDVMRFVDAMAMHKFNRLQIHLTDGQGWRLEILKYPLLTEIGSRQHHTPEFHRDQTQIYGGYYTQDDIRELVAFAARRHVTIIPEIEMPHHAGSAIVAYPELGPDPSALVALPIAERWRRAGDTVVPRLRTVSFFQDVLDEVVALFPSPHIHIGGDEADTAVWARLPEMQAWMQDQKLKDVHELHSWFIRQMDQYLSRKGRQLVGWDEILQGGLADGATVMSWRGVEGGITAAKAAHDVIMAPTSHTYFDYREGINGPAGLGSAEITLRQVYGFEPIPSALSPAEARHVLGGQGQLWGELIADERHREYQTYPRACALAEVLWSPPAGRNFDEFRVRLVPHLRRLAVADVHCRPLDP